MQVRSRPDPRFKPGLYSTDASDWGRHRCFERARVSLRTVSSHLDPVPELPEDEIAWFDDGGVEPLPRPVWWRWVAVVLVVALVVATPFAYALYRVFH